MLLTHLSNCRCNKITDSVPAGREPDFVSCFESYAVAAMRWGSGHGEFSALSVKNYRSTATVSGVHGKVTVFLFLGRMRLVWSQFYRKPKRKPTFLRSNKNLDKAVVGRLHSRLGDALVVVVALVLVNLPQRRVVLLALENGKQALRRME